MKSLSSLFPSDRGSCPVQVLVSEGHFIPGGASGLNVLRRDGRTPKGAVGRGGIPPGARPQFLDRLCCIQNELEQRFTLK